MSTSRLLKSAISFWHYDRLRGVAVPTFCLAKALMHALLARIAATRRPSVFTDGGRIAPCSETTCTLTVRMRAKPTTSC